MTGTGGVRRPVMPGEQSFGPHAITGFRWVPQVLLVVSALISLIDRMSANSQTGPLVPVFAVTVGASVWTCVCFGHGLDGNSSATRVVVYFAGRVGFTIALVLLGPWFGVYGWFAYVEAIRYFRLPYVFVAIAAAAVPMSFSYQAGVPHSSATWALWAVIWAGSTVLVGAFAIGGHRSFLRDAERENTLLELQRANERLAGALTENRGLHDQLMAQAREAGVLDERARLAGEIHDTLAQALTGIVTQLQAAERSGETTARAPHVERARGLAQSGLAEARRSLSALRPSELVDSGLPEALRETASRWSSGSGVDVLLDVNGAVVALGADCEVALLRVAQEALANVARHAQASKVGVTLTYLADRVLLDVRDDGIGFDPSAVTAGLGGHSLGLATMRERLVRVGGALDVESDCGSGTALVARVPAG